VRCGAVIGVRGYTGAGRGLTDRQGSEHDHCGKQ
jgi:hypothetical protein